MATGKLDIINLALLRIGESPIQSIDEGSTPAKSAKTLYDISRRAVLRDFDWAFAMKTTSLPLLVTEDEEEPGVYTCLVPSDCLRVVQVMRRGDRGHSDFGELSYPVEGGGELRFIGERADRRFIRTEWFRVQGKQLFVRIPSPYVRYVRDEEDTDLFDSKFVEAFSYKLAGELAMPVRQDTNLMASMLNAYQGLIGRGGEESQNEHNDALQNNPYVDVRFI
jgi:hypothetical protein